MKTIIFLSIALLIFSCKKQDPINNYPPPSQNDLCGSFTSDSVYISSVDTTIMSDQNNYVRLVLDCNGNPGSGSLEWYENGISQTSGDPLSIYTKNGVGYLMASGSSVSDTANGERFTYTLLSSGKWIFHQNSQTNWYMRIE